MDLLPKSRELNRSIALALSALFILALASAQPHRVHHFFQQKEQAHHHGDSDSSDHHPSKAPAKAEPECVIQTVSQHCAAIPVELATLAFISPGLEIFQPILSRWVYHFTSSPLSQRAPPRVFL